MKLRRLGKDSSKPCANGCYCPQLLEDEGGDFIAVGEDVTVEVMPALPAGPGIGPNEKAVRIPRFVMLAARQEIPAA